MGEVIVITSGKGGVGKTTTTANLGAGLSRLDKKTVIIDTDLGLRNLDVVLGLENLIVYNLVDVIEGTCRLKQALIRDKRYENLYLLPSAQTKDKTAISPEQMRKLTAELREEYDYILLDCPAGIEQGFQNAIAGADRALVVTTPEVSAIRDADRKCLGFQKILGRFVVLIDEQRNPVAVANHPPRGVHGVHLAIFVVGSDNQYRHGIYGLYNTKILFHQDTFFPKLRLPTGRVMVSLAGK